VRFKKLLFENLDKAIKAGSCATFAQPDTKNPEILHSYCFLNDTPLNQANSDLKVYFLVYEEPKLNNYASLAF